MFITFSFITLIIKGVIQLLTFLKHYWFLFKSRLAGPILDIEGTGAIFGAHFLKKRHFVCSHPLNRCHL